jgi:LPXTG-motif cell wall-anchored protein
MDIVGTTIHALSDALAHVDHAAVTPLVAGASVVLLGLWLLARRRRTRNA